MSKGSIVLLYNYPQKFPFRLVVLPFTVFITIEYITVPLKHTKVQGSHFYPFIFNILRDCKFRSYKNLWSFFIQNFVPDTILLYLLQTSTVIFVIVNGNLIHKFGRLIKIITFTVDKILYYDDLLGIIFTGHKGRLATASVCSDSGILEFHKVNFSWNSVIVITITNLL